MKKFVLIIITLQKLVMGYIMMNLLKFVGGYPEFEMEDVNAVLITKKGFRLGSFIK